jgi:hypothetical protein
VLVMVRSIVLSYSPFLVDLGASGYSYGLYD